MCGIVGFHLSPSVRDGTPKDKLASAVKKSIHSIRHRGPDMNGVWINQRSDLALGHTRLSIIDTDPRSKQPMQSDDESTILTFNGEIYNYRELRKQHPSKNWKTASDTEVLLEQIASLGADSLNTLDGMFAFASYDKKKHELLLAVDPAGKKPLYVYFDGKVFAFASEMKALWASGLCNKELNDDYIAPYLFYGYVPAPLTAFKYVTKLLPGHYMKLDCNNMKMKTKKYWQLELGGSSQPKKNLKHLQEEVQLLIQSAVGKRLISDVPLGAFLSGGLDSSIICLEANRTRRENPIRAFSVGFDSQKHSEYDETHYAKKVAALVGSPYKELRIDASNVEAKDILLNFDEPYADSSAIPHFFLCREARKHITVALSGDGGDEVFGGYLRFKSSKIANSLGTPLKLFLTLMPKLKANSPRSTLGYFSRLQEAIKLSPQQKLARWTAFFPVDEIQKRYRISEEIIYDQVEGLWKESHGADFGNRILHLNFKSYLFNDLLPKVDRTSMASSLEVRSPFLDKKLVEYMFALPSHLKFNFLNTKILLKSIYRNELGTEIVDRKKKGFGFPIEDFLPKEGFTHDTNAACSFANWSKNLFSPN